MTVRRLGVKKMSVGAALVGGREMFFLGEDQGGTMGRGQLTSNEELLTHTLCLIMNISCCSGWKVTYSARPYASCQDESPCSVDRSGC